MMAHMLNVLITLRQKSAYHTEEQLHWSLPTWLPYMVDDVMLCDKPTCTAPTATEPLSALVIACVWQMADDLADERRDSIPLLMV